MLRQPPKPTAKPKKRPPRLHREGLRRPHTRHKQRILRLQRRSHHFTLPLRPWRRTRLLPPCPLPLPQLRNLLLQHLSRRRRLPARPLQSQLLPSRRRPRQQHRPLQNLLHQLLLRLPPLLLHRLRRNSRGLQLRLVPQHNNLRHALRKAALRQEDAHSNLVNNLRRRALLLLHSLCVPVRPVPVNRAHHSDDRCPLEIVGRFLEQFPVADAPVVRAPANLCARNNPAKGRDVRLHLVLEVPVVRAEQAFPIVRGDKGPVLSRPARVPALVLPAVPRCCRRCPTKCRRKQSPASRCIRASRHNASVPRQISARWKVSASFTQRVSVPAQVGVVPQSRPLRPPNHARRATSL